MDVGRFEVVAMGKRNKKPLPPMAFFGGALPPAPKDEDWKETEPEAPEYEGVLHLRAVGEDDTIPPVSLTVPLDHLRNLYIGDTVELKVRLTQS